VAGGGGRVTRIKIREVVKGARWDEGGTGVVKDREGWKRKRRGGQKKKRKIKWKRGNVRRGVGTGGGEGGKSEERRCEE